MNANQLAQVKNAVVNELEIFLRAQLPKVVDKGLSAATPSTPTRRGSKATPARPQRRRVRNGVREPAPGGLCAAVWSAMDQAHKTGIEPSVRDARMFAEANDTNVKNAEIEYYNWRKFNNIKTH